MRCLPTCMSWPAQHGTLEPGLGGDAGRDGRARWSSPQPRGARGAGARAAAERRRLDADGRGARRGGAAFQVRGGGLVTSAQLEIQAIAAVVAAACALPGVFLVLRRMALISDAISHAILPGIVLAFFVVEDFPRGSVAAVVAMGGTACSSAPGRSRAGAGGAHRDRPPLPVPRRGLIARYAGRRPPRLVAVRSASLPSPRSITVVAGYDLGTSAALADGRHPASLNALFIFVFSELKLATFDAGLASCSLVAGARALRADGARLDHGSRCVRRSRLVLVVALFFAPPATAYLLTDRLPRDARSQRR